VTVGPDEQFEYAELRRTKGISVYDRHNVYDLIADIRRATLIIANDCGPMHVAAALNKPTLGIFGPTNPRCWFPYSGSHRRYCQETSEIDHWGRIDNCSAWDHWPTPAAVWELARSILLPYASRRPTELGMLHRGHNHLSSHHFASGERP
jgi:ADP-heptose:LPS heptosyltransferase